jgi:hypothetical protein
MLRRILKKIGKSAGFLLAIALAAVVGGATGAMVMAAIPDSNGQINACYKNSTHVLSVTDPAGNCAGNETPLSWGQGGSGNIIGNEANLDYGTTTPQVLLTIPQMGNFLGTCDQDGNITTSFQNTSNSIIEFGARYIQPGDSTGFGGGALSIGTGNQFKIAWVQGNIWADSSVQKCHFPAQGVLNY